jgi:hypothetical protein
MSAKIPLPARPSASPADLKVALESALAAHFKPIIDRYVDEHFTDYRYSPSEFVLSSDGQVDIGRIEDLVSYWTRQPETLWVDRDPAEARVSGIEINWYSVDINSGEDWDMI